MSLLGAHFKTPVERVDYDIDLGPELAGDQITDIAWVSSAPSELVVGTGPNGLPAPSIAKGKAKVWLGGGLPGKLYTVSANVSTAKGRVLSRGFGIQMIDDSRWPRPRPEWLTPVIALTVLVVGLGVVVIWRTRPRAAAAVQAPAPAKISANRPLLAAGRSRSKPPRSKRRTKKHRW